MGPGGRWNGRLHRVKRRFASTDSRCGLEMAAAHATLLVALRDECPRWSAWEGSGSQSVFQAGSQEPWVHACHVLTRLVRGLLRRADFLRSE